MEAIKATTASASRSSISVTPEASGLLYPRRRMRRAGDCFDDSARESGTLPLREAVDQAIRANLK